MGAVIICLGFLGFVYLVLRMVLIERKKLTKKEEDKK